MIEQKLNIKFHTPDIRWEIYNAYTYEQYLEKYVYPPKFHSKVPEDILKDYETIERLLAFAYYHWPIYDEGVKKLHLTFEMAIKLRCKEVGIPIEYKTKKGERKNYTLNYLIKELGKKEPLKPIDFQLNQGRKNRNLFSHPDQHSFGGALFQMAVPSVVNTINFLFLNEEVFAQAIDKLEETRTLIENFREGCFILEMANKRYLSRGVECIEAWLINETWTYLFVVYPVVENLVIEEGKSNYPGKPILLQITDLNVKDHILKAKTSDDKIGIFSTDKQENIEIIQQFNNVLDKADISDKSIYVNLEKHYIGEYLIKYRYNNYWM